AGSGGSGRGQIRPARWGHFQRAGRLRDLSDSLLAATYLHGQTGAAATAVAPRTPKANFRTVVAESVPTQHRSLRKPSGPKCGSEDSRSSPRLVVQSSGSGGLLSRPK